jgi:hypothetical protein
MAGNEPSARAAAQLQTSARRTRCLLEPNSWGGARPFAKGCVRGKKVEDCSIRLRKDVRLYDALCHREGRGNRLRLWSESAHDRSALWPFADLHPSAEALGPVAESASDVAADEERSMRHHHYHCERNPEGFRRLVAENLERKLREQTRREAAGLKAAALREWPGERESLAGGATLLTRLIGGVHAKVPDTCTRRPNIRWSRYGSH